MLDQHPLRQHPSLTAILEKNGISPTINNQASKLRSCRALLLRQRVIQRQYSQGEGILSLCRKGVTFWIGTVHPGAHCIQFVPADYFQKRGQMRSLLIIGVNPAAFSFPWLPSLKCHKVSSFFSHSSAMTCCPKAPQQ